MRKAGDGPVTFKAEGALQAAFSPLQMQVNHA